jgi:hypothetical protein
MTNNEINHSIMIQEPPQCPPGFTGAPYSSFDCQPKVKDIAREAIAEIIPGRPSGRKKALFY